MLTQNIPALPPADHLVLEKDFPQLASQMSTIDPDATDVTPKVESSELKRSMDEVRDIVNRAQL